MYTLKCCFRFEAGHSLKEHQGNCQYPHGHSYLVTLYLQGEALQEQGSQKNMVIDAHEVAHIVTPVIKHYCDHKWLNDSLKTDSPTAEFIARWLFDHLKPKLSQLSAVNVSETECVSATYTPDKIPA